MQPASTSVQYLANMIFEHGECFPDADYKKALDTCQQIFNFCRDKETDKHTESFTNTEWRTMIQSSSQTILNLRQEIEQLKLTQVETENHFGIISDAWVSETQKVDELEAKLNKALAENLPHSY